MLEKFVIQVIFHQCTIWMYKCIGCTSKDCSISQWQSLYNKSIPNIPWTPPKWRFIHPLFSICMGVQLNRDDTLRQPIVPKDMLSLLKDQEIPGKCMKSLSFKWFFISVQLGVQVHRMYQQGLQYQPMTVIIQQKYPKHSLNSTKMKIHSSTLQYLYGCTT